jgi:hypothetical protein
MVKMRAKTGFLSMKFLKYFAAIILLGIIIFNLCIFDSFCKNRNLEGFDKSGLINMDKLKEKVEKKVEEYDGVIAEMQEIINKINELEQ